MRIRGNTSDGSGTTPDDPLLNVRGGEAEELEGGP